MKTFASILIGLLLACGSAWYIVHQGLVYLSPLVVEPTSTLDDLFPDTTESRPAHAYVPDTGMYQDGESSSSSSATSGDTTKAEHVYAEYRDGIVGNGARIALFFYDAKDPESVAVETRIKAIKMSTGLGIDIYRVSFDAESVLAKAYDVVHAHTLVIIDGTGAFVQSLSAPTNEQLELLQ